MDRHTNQQLLAAGVILLIFLLVPIPFLNSGQYQALAGGVQAFGVVLALLLASATIRSDVADRRVDRSLKTHEEFTSGEVGAARHRLVGHLKEAGTDGRTARVKVSGLRGETYSQSAHSAHNPFDDAKTVLRYFESVNAARTAGALSFPLFHELVGRQAAWWREAIIAESEVGLNRPLTEIAEWANKYAREHQRRGGYLDDWGNSRRRAFGTSPSP